MESVSIPIERIMGITRIPLGFQPLGITAKAQPDGQYLLAIADYFCPGIFLASLEIGDAELKLSASRVQGVAHVEGSVRVFPRTMLPEGNDVFRTQTVNFDREGRLWARALPFQLILIGNSEK